jgi:hypothetical protein
MGCAVLASFTPQDLLKPNYFSLKQPRVLLEAKLHLGFDHWVGGLAACSIACVIG